MESTAVNGARVLVVEDEMLVAMFVEDLLSELGYTVAGVISQIDEGLKRAELGDFDLALLDVHLNGKDVFPLADILSGKNIPFIFATGYGERGLPERYRGRPVLQKPYHPDELAAILGKTKSS